MLETPRSNASGPLSAASTAAARFANVNPLISVLLLGHIGSHMDITSGRAGPQAKCRNSLDFPETTLVGIYQQELSGPDWPSQREPATSSLGIHSFVRSRSLARVSVAGLLNLQRLAESVFSRSVAPNEAQLRRTHSARWSTCHPGGSLKRSSTLCRAWVRLQRSALYLTTAPVRAFTNAA